MAREIMEVEDVLADDSFRSWYYREQNEAAEKWAAWMDAHPSKINLVEKAVQLMQAMPQDIVVDKAATDAAWAKLNEALPAPRPARRSTVLPLWRWAAAAAAVFIIGFWAVRQYDIRNPEKSWQTAYGETDTVLLADGSEVIMNANSRLRGLDVKKGKNDRELWLEGEAFFHVKSTGNGQRMLVHTSAGDVVVTGTRFNVYDRKNGVSVLLTEGSVNILDSTGKEWPLKPGEMARLTSDQVTISAADTVKALAWKKGLIELDKTSVGDFARLVKDHYGKEVVIKGTTDATLSGLMPNNRLDDLLRAAAMVHNWKIEPVQDSILIVVN